MKKYNLFLIIILIVLLLASSILATTLALNINIFKKETTEILLNTLLTISLLLSIGVLTYSKIYLKNIEEDTKALSESLKEKELPKKSPIILHNIFKEIEETVKNINELQKELENVRSENNTLRDYVKLLETGEIAIPNTDIQEIKNLISRTSNKINTLYNTFFTVIKNLSKNIYYSQEEIFSLEYEIEKVNESLVESNKSIDSLSKSFVSLSEKLNEFVNTLINSYKNLDKFLEISKILETASEKFSSKFDEIIKLNIEIYNEISDMINNTKSISDISEQTLILAMNTSIEAYKTEKTEKGFSVIADEIRKLSESITKFSKTTLGKLQTLKGKSNMMTISLETLLEDSKKIGTTSKEIESISNNTSQTFRIIIDQTEVISSNINNISYRIYNHTEKSKILEESIGKILNEVTNKIKNQLSESTEFIDDLRNELSKKIKIKNAKMILSLSIADHVLWVSRLKAFIDNKATIDEDVIFDHTKCRLGKWYYSDLARDFSDIPEFKSIEKPHEKLHALGKTIVETKAKNPKETRKMFRDLLDLSHIIVDNLSKLENIATSLSAEEYFEKSY
ncbi:MAG: CZB domain-containing protein [Brevinematia bacterium]